MCTYIFLARRRVDTWIPSSEKGRKRNSVTLNRYKSVTPACRQHSAPADSQRRLAPKPAHAVPLFSLFFFFLFFGIVIFLEVHLLIWISQSSVNKKKYIKK
jgi:hypothetical protein